MTISLFNRISKYIEQRNSCWVWTGALTDGYGTIQVEGKSRRAHRLVYELLVGTIPQGLQLDHLCRNRACINPDHLEPVTGRVNVLRGRTIAAHNTSKTACHNGHLFDEANTYHAKGKGSRECRRCRRDAWLRYRARAAA